MRWQNWSNQRWLRFEHSTSANVSPWSPLHHNHKRPQSRLMTLTSKIPSYGTNMATVIRQLPLKGKWWWTTAAIKMAMKLRSERYYKSRGRNQRWVFRVNVSSSLKKGSLEARSPCVCTNALVWDKEHISEGILFNCWECTLLQVCKVSFYHTTVLEMI